MSIKEDLKKQLTELGIAFEDTTTVAELKVLLPDEEGTDEKADEKADEDGFIIKDPLVYKPVNLPLVITLPAGASKAQIAFAKTLNAYAYQNPEKWNEKKDDRTVTSPTGGTTVVKGLISQLKDLKNAPDPVEDNLTINQKNTL